FRHWLATGRPRVTVKFAASLDGRVASGSGDSAWITGELARAHVHRVRDTIDVIMVGVGTVLADDPQLTARPDGAFPPDGRQPVRVIVDSLGRTPPTARALRQPGRTIIAHVPAAPSARLAALREAGAETVCVPEWEQRVDLAALIALLGERGLIDVQIEGGPTLAGSAFDRGVVDRVQAYLAPIIIGGAGAPAVRGRGAATMAHVWRLTNPALDRFGDDICITGDVARGEAQ
ncbi:MAG: RibD family protein, partial [Dehalococcoidia bacterium]|nr:RibD family protein [Dehalococcoidia bacterium]